MSKFHSTVSRRDFMKGLGLAGAGLGAAAATAPVFHDLDELASSKTTHPLPWWVKEVDEPTVPIDWSILDYTQSADRYRNSSERGDQLLAARIQRRESNAIQGTPNSTQRDIALSDSIRVAQRSIDIADPDFEEVWLGYGKHHTAIYKGLISPYDAGPEQNLRTLQAAGHFFGTPQVGVIAIDDHFRKLSSREVPDDGLRYVVVCMVVQNHVVDKWGAETYKDGPGKGYPPDAHHIGGFKGYFNGPILSIQMNSFIKALGWRAEGRGSAYNVADGVMAGNTELTRTGMAGCPEHGISLRYMRCMKTDMPLAPTKPIDAGIFEFCKSCKTCALNCPPGSLSMETEPTWEGNVWEGKTINRPGVCKWPNDWSKCSGYGSPRDCGVCHASCPLNSTGSHYASIHKMVAATIATTPIFNGFLASMDRTFGYGKMLDGEEWWDRDLRTWPYDNIYGVGCGH